MADIVTGTVSGQLDVSQLLMANGDVRREQQAIGADIRREQQLIGADIRRETALESGEVRRELAKESSDTRSTAASQFFAVNDRVGAEADRVVAQDTAYFIASTNAATTAARELASLKTLTDANADRLSDSIMSGVNANAAAAALSAEKIASAVALGQSQLSKELASDGQKTRDLINDMKYHDLNRSMIERNNELVEERAERRNHAARIDQLQSQVLQNHLQAFQSQLQTATQGTVNFGTMSGNAGRNASTNNVA